MKKRTIFYLLSVVIIPFLVLYYLLFTPSSIPSSDHFFNQIKRHVANRILKYIKPDPMFEFNLPASAVRLDIVIPIIEKDLPTLPYVIRGIRSQIMHPLGNIYLVAPESQKIREAAEQFKAIFVLEDTVLPKFRQSPPKAGWIKQQYLKLNADQFVQNEDYLVVDADTAFVRPQVFEYFGKTIFNAHFNYTIARKVMVQRALNLNKLYNFCFTIHHMHIEKSKLKALKERLEQIHQKPWQDALNELDVPEGGFSEYELYANFVLSEYPNEAMILHGRNIEIPRDKLDSFDTIVPALAYKAKSVSLHHFILLDK